MKNSLTALPCFNHVEEVLPIASGVSQSCFKVNADGKTYFAKTISDNTEVAMTAASSLAELSPSVIYYNHEWLVTDFINASNLALSTLNLDDKIALAMKLMVQCHQLKVTPEKLATSELIETLIDGSHYSLAQQADLLQFAQLLLAPINESKHNVCCHGDLNFSNVLINPYQETWLVDYECACMAPIEYDLAMFIAVNDINSDKIDAIIKQYQLLSPVKIDWQLLNHYRLYCYLVNGLWYFNTYLDTLSTEKRQTLLAHAKKQWFSLLSSLQANDSTLFSRLSIKLANILTTLNLSN